jgi:hypothetical protein
VLGRAIDARLGVERLEGRPPSSGRHREILGESTGDDLADLLPHQFIGDSRACIDYADSYNVAAR